MVRLRRVVLVMSVGCLAGACTKEGEPGGESSSSSSSGEVPTTGAATSTGDVTTTSGSGETGTAGSSSTGEPVDEEALCAAHSSHFVECFPGGPTVAEAEALCHDDLDAARTGSEACFAALAAYFACQSTTACEVYEDACLDEANMRINTCGG